MMTNVKRNNPSRKNFYGDSKYVVWRKYKVGRGRTAAEVADKQVDATNEKERPVELRPVGRSTRTPRNDSYN
jgi:hypothetical protein